MKIKIPIKSVLWMPKDMFALVSETDCIAMHIPTREIYRLQTQDPDVSFEGNKIVCKAKVTAIRLTEDKSEKENP